MQFSVEGEVRGKLDNSIRLDVMLVFDWRDGPLEGVVRDLENESCWYFKVLAEKLGTSVSDDRIFWMWRVPDLQAQVLCREFGRSEEGSLVWPSRGGIGSSEAIRVIDHLIEGRRGAADFIIRTLDFVDILQVWDVL